MRGGAGDDNVTPGDHDGGSDGEDEVRGGAGDNVTPGDHDGGSDGEDEVRVVQVATMSLDVPMTAAALARTK